VRWHQPGYAEETKHCQCHFAQSLEAAKFGRHYHCHLHWLRLPAAARQSQAGSQRTALLRAPTGRQSPLV